MSHFPALQVNPAGNPPPLVPGFFYARKESLKVLIEILKLEIKLIKIKSLKNNLVKYHLLSPD